MQWLDSQAIRLEQSSIGSGQWASNTQGRTTQDLDYPKIHHRS